MSLAKFSIDNAKLTYFAFCLFTLAGVGAFFNLGQLEDPEFSIKKAVIVTAYPGASADEVEQEVTDRIELAIQEMSQIDYIESYSRAGLSSVAVEMKPSFLSSELPQIWDELRRKIRDVEGGLPPGANRPIIGDDFGQVFGFQLAILSDGYSYSDLEKYAKELKKELSLVDGVARIDLWGQQRKVVYLETSKARLKELGVSNATISEAVENLGLVSDAGNLDLATERLRISPTGSFGKAEDIGEVMITPSVTDLTQNAGIGSQTTYGENSLRLSDIATIRTGLQQPATTLLRYNGRDAIGVSITNIEGSNVVEIGERIDARLQELIHAFPVGIEVEKVHWQSTIVDDAVNAFLINFLEAVLIVIVVLTIGMGWRMSVIIGTALVVTVLLSFIVMALLEINLQRMSLGALVIALGMMVDNAIVVADGYIVRIKQGVDKRKAAIESAQIPSMPLLGATFIAVLAFFPIYMSEESAGEYCATLFSVVGISLIISWLVSVTLTPLQCMALIKEPENESGDESLYDGKFYQIFRAFLLKCVKAKYLVIAVMLGFLTLSAVGYQQVDKLFFPDSSMTKFMVDYWAPEGTRIETVSKDIRKAEAHILSDEKVVNVSSYIGSGPPRFYLPVEPEPNYSSYAQLIVNVKDYKSIPAYMNELNGWFRENYQQANVSIRPFAVGPGNTWKFELRLSAPSDATASELRTIAGKYEAILRESPYADMIRTDWRQMVPEIVPNYSQDKGRWSNISRSDLSMSIKQAFDGQVIGLFREKDDLIPIVMRPVETERSNVGGLDVIPIQPFNSITSTPLSQVVDGTDLKWKDPIRWRRERLSTITIQSNPIPGVTLPTLHSDVAAKMAAVELPEGYRIEWGGEFESSRDSQASLVPGIVPALALMALIMVALFNAYKPPLIITLTIPFVFVGIVVGLLVFDTPFGFVALLGAMSLSGMMIKNAIVLLDQAKIEVEAGKDRHSAILEAAMSRLRPVFLAAATTVLGVIPLLQDVFWVGLAVTIMAGLTFGTFLTMILVPVFYTIFYKPTTLLQEQGKTA